MSDQLEIASTPVTVSRSTDAQGRRVAHISEAPPQKGQDGGGDKAKKGRSGGGGGAPAREGMRKNADYKAVSTAPSINKTPVGNSTPPLPYPTFQDLANSEAFVPTVTLNGDQAYVLNQTEQPSGKGDDPGTAKGVKSGTVNGYVKPTGASSTVTIGGKKAVRIGDPNVMNGGNNPGLYVTAEPASANPAKSAAQTSTPPQTLETPAEKSWYERGRDYFKEKLTPAVEQPVEATKGAAKGIANTPSHLGDMVIQGNMLQQAAELEQQAMLQSAFGLDAAAQSTSEAAQAIREASGQVNLPKFEMSNKAQESGDFIATGVQLLTGLAGMTKAVAKGIPALLKEAKVAETVAADTAKVAGKTAAKGADEAADVAAAGATKEIKSPGDGVVVKPKHPLRAEYEAKVRGLKTKEQELRMAGKSDEEIARTLNADRRALGVEYKDLTPPDKLAEIYERNMAKYDGDKLGPTADLLRARGKTWEEIIESATRPGGKDLGL